jgi:hypothetical protein
MYVYVCMRVCVCVCVYMCVCLCVCNFCLSSTRYRHASAIESKYKGVPVCLPNRRDNQTHFTYFPFDVPEQLYNPNIILPFK